MTDDQSQGSSQPLRVDTDKLRPAIAKLQKLASNLTSAGESLENVSQSYGQPWGNDKTGEQFYAQYQGPHGDVITAALQGGKGLNTAADQASDLIWVFEQVEEQAGSAGQYLKSDTDQNP
ncbi:hypothetical protein ACFZAR_40770 [Streptomyces sp. NPDC008222]|uniref:hypothetical protein n=1 Tax=Streptomyces sp. NPDC008222 TaxID=3364820 RepID=UPI0036DFB7FD